MNACPYISYCELSSINCGIKLVEVVARVAKIVVPFPEPPPTTRHRCVVPSYCKSADASGAIDIDPVVPVRILFTASDDPAWLERVAVADPAFIRVNNNPFVPPAIPAIVCADAPVKRMSDAFPNGALSIVPTAEKSDPARKASPPETSTDNPVPAFVIFKAVEEELAP